MGKFGVTATGKYRFESLFPAVDGAGFSGVGLIGERSWNFEFESRDCSGAPLEGAAVV